MTPRIRFGLFIVVLLLAASPVWPRQQQQLTPITINYPTRTGQVWPLYIAKEGGYYAKYGYDVKLAFGVHPAGIAMLVSGEAVMTPYKDKTFAIKAYLAWDKQEQSDIERVYDHYSKVNTYERIPYVLTPAVQYILDHPSDAQVGAQMKTFNFHTVIDNSIVERLVKEGFFEQLFGPGIKAEEERKAKLEFR